MSIQAMSWVLDYERTTTGTDRLVLLSLANHATSAPVDGAWESYPGIDLIRQEANIAKRQTVKDALARLVERGIISKDVQGAPDRRIRADRRPNLYRIHGGPPDGSPIDHGGPSQGATGAPPRADGGPSQGPQTVIEPTTEPNARHEVAQGSLVAVVSFEDFWREYPRRDALGNAERAWAKAAKIADPAAIVEAARRYAADPNRDPSYTAMAATWLNGKRWNDGPLPPRQNRDGRGVRVNAPRATPAWMRSRG